MKYFKNKQHKFNVCLIYLKKNVTFSCFEENSLLLKQKNKTKQKTKKTSKKVCINLLSSIFFAALKFSNSRGNKNAIAKA